uniref:Cell growth regulator with EF-hand domain 1 n=1 Tax=Panthera tigris altaica TaxID=74533 RepID=A0A8C9J975_PANTA
MLTAALAPGAADFPIANPVILVVDKVLETQDLNGDGLMTPAELINFPGEAPSHTEPKEPLEPQDLPPGQQLYPGAHLWLNPCARLDGGEKA